MHGVSEPRLGGKSFMQEGGSTGKVRAQVGWGGQNIGEDEVVLRNWLHRAR